MSDTQEQEDEYFKQMISENIPDNIARQWEVDDQWKVIEEIKHSQQLLEEKVTALEGMLNVKGATDTGKQSSHSEQQLQTIERIKGRANF